MKRAWELLVLVIIGSVMVQMLLDFIRPLIPYIGIVLLVGLVAVAGRSYIRSRQTW